MHPTPLNPWLPSDPEPERTPWWRRAPSERPVDPLGYESALPWICEEPQGEADPY